MSATTTQSAEETRAARERRALVFAPGPEDAALVDGALQPARVPGHRCESLDELRREFALGAGLMVVAAEVLQGAGFVALMNALDQQPSWSDIVFIVLASDADSVAPAVEELEQHTTVILLDRDSRGRAASSVVAAALRARRRQYDLREQLAAQAEGEPAARDPAVRDSEERYRAFVSQSSEGIWRFELREPIPVDVTEDEFIARAYEHGYLAECNDAMAAQYGYENAGEIIGASMADFMPRADPRNIEYLRAFIRGGYRLLDGESYEADRTGRIRCFRNNLIGIVQNGAVVRAWGTQREVTEIKAAEQALRQSEERLRVALRQSPMVVLQQDQDLRYTWTYNTRANFPTDNLIGKTDGEMLPSELAERMTAFKRRVLETGTPGREEIQMLIDGAIVTYDLSVEALRDESNAVSGLTIAAIDISERKGAEQALLESERRFRAMADNAPTLIWLAGQDKRLFYFNQPWLDFTGRSLDQELGSGWLEGVHPDDLPRCLDSYIYAVENERGFESDFRLRRADGEYRWVLNKGTPRYASDGTFLGFIGSCIDITERKLVEQRLAVEHAVTRELAGAQDLSEVASDILRLIGDGIGWTAGALWRRHPQRQTMVNVGFWHRADVVVDRLAAVTRAMSFPVGRGLPGLVYKDGNARWVEDLTADPGDARARIASEDGLRSGFAYPLSAGDDVLGIIEFFTDQPIVPDEGLASMLSAIASELGQFLQRTRVEEERNELLIGEETSRIIAESALKRLRDVLVVTDTALAHLSLDELLDELLVRVRTIFGCDTGSILLLSEDGTTLTPRASRGLTNETQDDFKIPVGRGVAGRIAAERQPLIILDLSKHEVVSPLLRTSIRSLVGAPLMAQNRLIGVIICGSRTQRLFSREDVALLELVAERAAVAIERVRLFEAERAALVQVEQAARRKDEAFSLLDAVFEGAPVGISFIDRSLRYVRVNEALAQMNGQPAAAHLGQRMEDVVPDLAPKVTLLIDGIFATGAPLLNYELSGRTEATPGLQFWLVNYYPIRDAEGEIIYVAATSTDITERKRLEQELRHHALRLEERVAERTEAVETRARELSRSNADLEQFAYVASHDLQEPLRMVTNFTQLLARRYVGKLGKDADEFIGFAVDGVDRMHRLITDLLSYSRVGQRTADIVPTDLDVVLEAVRSHLAPAIAESGAEITIDALPTVFADSTQMLQLFQNLVGNALKFRGASPPRIHLSAERITRKPGSDRRKERGATERTPPPLDRRVQSAAPEWLISVSDNGMGIPAEHAERIFVIFQRLHARDEYPGTGIGLAICKRIVERHGGRIWVEPRPEGGSVFRLTLPQPEAK
ncbi:MAG: PAS domain S-box protein [Gemmatimonadota bacterium]